MRIEVDGLVRSSHLLLKNFLSRKSLCLFIAEVFLSLFFEITNILILEKLKIYRVSSGFYIPLVWSFFTRLKVRSLFF